VPLLLDTSGTAVLADVLDSLELRGRVFCRCELSAPWASGFAAGVFRISTSSSAEGAGCGFKSRRTRSTSATRSARAPRFLTGCGAAAKLPPVFPASCLWRQVHA
jgi:hypothetical protein